MSSRALFAAPLLFEYPRARLSSGAHPATRTTRRPSFRTSSSLRTAMACSALCTAHSFSPSLTRSSTSCLLDIPPPIGMRCRTRASTACSSCLCSGVTTTCSVTPLLAASIVLTWNSLKASCTCASLTTSCRLIFASDSLVRTMASSCRTVMGTAGADPVCFALSRTSCRIFTYSSSRALALAAVIRGLHVLLAYWMYLRRKRSSGLASRSSPAAAPAAPLVMLCAVRCTPTTCLAMSMSRW
mmetsp:Transcript_6409/g.22567  ORF Transcript_6409/g.22567 Transcript_6409/m.22567 type:complete len:242 (+) Transcript_6409:44-769(+)